MCIKLHPYRLGRRSEVEKWSEIRYCIVFNVNYIRNLTRPHLHIGLMHALALIAYEMGMEGALTLLTLRLFCEETNKFWLLRLSFVQVLIPLGIHFILLICSDLKIKNRFVSLCLINF